MPAPAGLEPTLAVFLEELEGRLANLEAPQQPGRVYACTTTNMPSPGPFINCVLRNTTLNILAVSDGTNWRRQDTGAII